MATAKLARISIYKLLLLTAVSLAACSKRAADETAPAPSASVAPVPKPPHDAEAAWTQATQLFVKRRLYSPGTARFGSPSGPDQAPPNIVEHQGDGKYLVKGWVEGADPTGKVVRMSFEITIRYDPAAEGSWAVEKAPIVKVL